MSFRTKVFVTFLPLALLPLVAFAYLVRNEVSERLTRQFENQVETVTTAVTDELSSQSRRVGEALAGRDCLGQLLLLLKLFRSFKILGSFFEELLN